MVATTIFRSPVPSDPMSLSLLIWFVCFLMKSLLLLNLVQDTEDNGSFEGFKKDFRNTIRKIETLTTIMFQIKGTLSLSYHINYSNFRNVEMRNIENDVEM